MNFNQYKMRREVLQSPTRKTKLSNSTDLSQDVGTDSLEACLQDRNHINMTLVRVIQPQRTILGWAIKDRQQRTLESRTEKQGLHKYTIERCPQSATTLQAVLGEQGRIDTFQKQRHHLPTKNRFWTTPKAVAVPQPYFTGSTLSLNLWVHSQLQWEQKQGLKNLQNQGQKPIKFTASLRAQNFEVHDPQKVCVACSSTQRANHLWVPHTPKIPLTQTVTRN